MSDITTTEHTVVITENEVAVTVTPVIHALEVTTGVTDHGRLTGLNDDDHPQYLTQDRADARYIRTIAGAGDATYRHVQMIAATAWTIDHNLEKYPSVSIVDTSKRVVYGNIEYLSLNSVRVIFIAAFAGEAYCN